jgi:hypothetical protein
MYFYLGGIEFWTCDIVNRTLLIHSQYKLLQLSNSSACMFKALGTVSECGNYV